MKHFVKHSMFTRLLERKLWANRSEDVIDTMFFDENIRLKLNRYKKNSKNVIHISTYHLHPIVTRDVFPER